MKLGIKSLTATVAVAAFLVLAAMPSGAVVSSLTATGGTLTTTVGTFVLGPGGTTPPCGASTGGIDIDLDATTPVHNLTVQTTGQINTSFTHAGSGNSYLVEIKATGGSGTANDSTGAVSTTATLQARIYNTTLPGCAKGTQKCIANVPFAAGSPLSGSVTAGGINTNGTLQAGTKVTVSGTSGNVGTAACSAPMTALTNSTVGVASLELSN